MRAAPLFALAAALVLAGCARETPTSTDAPSGGVAYGARVAHDASAPTGPRAFVLNGSYAPGAQATLLTYVHGPLDDAWGLALRGGWHLARDGAGWRLNATVVEQRLAPQTFHATPAAVDLLVTGSLPDGAYTVSVLCTVNDLGHDRPCDSPAPLSFTIAGGRLAS